MEGFARHATGGSASSLAMRVLHVVNKGLPDTFAGYTIRTQQVALAQQAAGIEPIIACLDFHHRKREQKQSYTHEGIRYFRLSYPSKPGWNGDWKNLLGPFALQLGARIPGEKARQKKFQLLTQWAIEQLKPIVAWTQPQIVHAHSPHYCAEVAQGIAGGRPWVYENRGLWEESAVAQGIYPQGGERYLFTKAAEIAASRSATMVTALNVSLRRELNRRSIDGVRITPNTVDLQRFSPQPADVQLAAQIGLKAELPVIGYVGSIRTLEGIDHTIQAFAHLRKQGAEAQLMLVGDGSEKAELEQLCRRLGIEDRVVFTGRVPFEEVPRYYHLIDIFVVSRPDIAATQMVTPLKPLEAMACAKPVICSRLEALQEFVGQDEDRGRTYPAGDTRALAEVIQELLKEPKQCRQLGLQARAFVEAERSLDSLGRTYRQLYQELSC